MNFLINENSYLSVKLKIILLVIGLICLFIASLTIFLYCKKINREKTDRNKFKIVEKQTKYKIFYFWSHIVYILIIFASFVAAIILLSVFIGSFT